MKFLNVESKQKTAQHIATGINSLTKMFHVVVFMTAKEPEPTPDLFANPSMEVSIL